MSPLSWMMSLIQQSDECRGFEFSLPNSLPSAPPNESTTRFNSSRVIVTGHFAPLSLSTSQDGTFQYKPRQHDKTSLAGFAPVRPTRLLVSSRVTLTQQATPIHVNMTVHIRYSSPPLTMTYRIVVDFPCTSPIRSIPQRPPSTILFGAAQFWSRHYDISCPLCSLLFYDYPQRKIKSNGCF